MVASRGAKGEESACRLLARSLAQPARQHMLPCAFLLDSGKMEGSVSSVPSKSCTLVFGLLGMEPRASGTMLAKCLPRSSFTQCPFLTQEGESRSLERATSHGFGPALAWGLWVSVRTGAKRDRGVCCADCCAHTAVPRCSQSPLTTDLSHCTSHAWELGWL
jgi:hypothetical protein